MTTSRSRGVSLLEFEDDYGVSSDGHQLEYDGEEDLPTTGVSAAVKRAIIVEKSNGDPVQIIAVRYDVTPATVNKIWREFVSSTVDVRRLGDENLEIFKTKIRRKAVNAIENGLDCDRDPYRQGALGVQVMKGIGEFKQEDAGGVRVNVLIGSVPVDWKQRYIGNGGNGQAQAQKDSDK